MASALAILSLAAGIIGGLQQAKAAKKAAKREKRARQTAENRDKYRQIKNTRKEVRLARIKSQEIIAASENTGTTGSTGEFGALAGFAQTSFGQRADSKGINVANIEINRLYGQAADIRSRAASRGALFNAFGSALKGFSNIFA